MLRTLSCLKIRRSYDRRKIQRPAHRALLENESRATRQREKEKGLSLFKDQSGGDWYNRLIWGDNKYIMASLLEEFAGKIYLIYIDPPFATGVDFSVKMTLGDAEWTKEPSDNDDKITEQIKNALETVGIDLQDHMIIAGDEYFSYRQTGYLE